MRNRSKIQLAGLTAALLMSVAVGSASANRLSVSNRNFRIAWTPLTLEPGNVRCNVTFEGSFHSATITKVAGALVGHITRALVQNETCQNGTITIKQERLPWHVRYRSFTGTLPNITGINLSVVGMSFSVFVASLGTTCEVTTTTEEPYVGVAEVISGTINGMRTDETTGILLGGLCSVFGTRGAFAGIGRVTLLGATTAISVRLI